MDDYKYLFKVVVIGNTGVGKTCLVRRFAQGIFPPGQGATIGVDFLLKTVLVNNEKIKLQIWDTAGQERFRAITQTYYRSAAALILVYDITSQPSFDCLPQWIKEIEAYASPSIIRILVGNKSDLLANREVPRHVGEDFARQHSMSFLEASALECDNVDSMFYQVAEQLVLQLKTADQDLCQMRGGRGGVGLGVEVPGGFSLFQVHRDNFANKCCS